jgi:propionyl-CoA carboxylase alpha chain
VIRKLLIANRGEIVVRIARTCRELGIATAGVHSEPDAHGLHVRACDESIALGGSTPAESYLRGEAIVEAALRVGADAVHPGFGFLAENASFAQQVLDAGLTWVGPSPDAIAAMGDKLEAKSLMAEAGVPILGSIAVMDGTDLDAAWDEVGGPVLVKAAAGGGGKGMRIVRDRADLADEVAAAQRESRGAFGDERVFLERYVTRPRHIEIQVVGDSHGDVVHFFERECSIQRRYQKVVEESPSPAVTPHLREAMGDAAVAAAKAIGYENAGTVEFILGEDGDFFFLEMNTRLQVEHPVTELVTGVDLVRTQLAVAEGRPLPFEQDELGQRGHAIEVRLYAEDPAAGYLPATGTLHSFIPSRLAGVRWDSGVESGSVVSPHYDPMLAKVIAYAATRDDAARLLARALDGTVIHGVTTNRDLLAGILRDEAYLAGDTTTAYLDERFPSEDDRRFEPSEEAVRLAATIAALHAEAGRVARRTVLSTIPSGWRNSRAYDQRAVYLTGGREVEVHYRLERDGSWTVTVVESGTEPSDGEPVTVSRTSGGPGAVGQVGAQYEVGGRRFRPFVSVHEAPVTGDRRIHVTTPAGSVTLDQRQRFPRSGLEETPGATLAPMPGTVVAVAVDDGREVASGDLLVTVEAMKMEHRITAPHDGTVAEVRVSDGQQVDAGEVLVVVEPG